MNYDFNVGQNNGDYYFVHKQPALPLSQSEVFVSFFLKAEFGMSLHCAVVAREGKQKASSIGPTCLPGGSHVTESWCVGAEKQQKCKSLGKYKTDVTASFEHAAAGSGRRSKMEDTMLIPRTPPKKYEKYI